MDKVFNVLIIILFGLIFLSCSEEEKNLQPYSNSVSYTDEEETETDELHEEYIKIGVALPLSGILEDYGESLLNGIVMALDEINQPIEDENGGVPVSKPMLVGGEVMLVVEDTLLNKETALTIIEKFSYIDKVNAIVGGYSSEVVIEMSDVVAETNLTFITPASISDEITYISDNNTIFRTVPSADFQGKLLGKIAREQRIYNYVGILHQDNTYGKSIADSFKSEFTNNSGVCDFFPYNYHDMPYNMNELMENLTFNMSRYSGKKGLLIIGYPEDTRILLNYLEYNEIDAEVIFGDGIQDPSIIKNYTDRYIDSSWGIGKSTYDSSYLEEFNTKYNDKFDSYIIPYTYNAYDAMAIILLAIAKVGDANDKDGIKQAVYDVTNEPGEQIHAGDIKRGIELLEKGEEINYIGLVGDLEFDENGDVVYGLNIWEFEKSEVVYKIWDE